VYERDEMRKPRRSAKRSLLKTIELLFAILRILATFSVCLLIFLLIANPDGVRGVVAALVSLSTPEREIAALPANTSEPLPIYTYPPTYTPPKMEVTSILLPGTATSVPTSVPTSTLNLNLPTGGLVRPWLQRG
jgi:hypothetical protein